MVEGSYGIKIRPKISRVNMYFEETYFTKHFFKITVTHLLLNHLTFSIKLGN